MRPGLLLLALSLAFPGPALAEESAPLLVVVPLGDASPELVDFVVSSLKSRFTFEVRLEAPIAMPKEAWTAPRKRWRAEKILDTLDALPAPGAWRIAAITEEPISTTKGKVADWGIAGLGRMGGRSAVFSAYYFSRFKRTDREKYHRYVENLVLHEIGHTLGLEHCPLDRCIMADAKGNAVIAAERSINEFCPRCFRKIRRWLRAEKVQGEWSHEEEVILSREAYQRD
jgi:archaemetzincin